jgi:N-acetylneuraminic acid mutarotase
MVEALAVVGSDLYVGGHFGGTGDGTTLTDLGRIARYDAVASTWHALPHQGLDSGVVALAAVGSDLYVGGWFNGTGDGTTLTDLGRIARYDTVAGTWHALPNEGLNDHVWELAVVGSDLYVGGYFDQTGDGTVGNLNHIARYDTVASTWHALPMQGLNGTVYALTAVGSDLYVGGGFTDTVGMSRINLGHIAPYDTVAGAWRALPNQGLNGFVLSLAAAGSDLYVGGDFTQTGDGTVTGLGDIARYDLYPNKVYLPLVMRE